MSNAAMPACRSHDAGGLKAVLADPGVRPLLATVRAAGLDEHTLLKGVVAGIDATADICGPCQQEVIAELAGLDERHRAGALFLVIEIVAQMLVAQEHDDPGPLTGITRAFLEAISSRFAPLIEAHRHQDLKLTLQHATNMVGDLREPSAYRGLLTGAFDTIEWLRLVMLRSASATAWRGRPFRRRPPDLRPSRVLRSFFRPLQADLTQRHYRADECPQQIQRPDRCATEPR